MPLNSFRRSTLLSGVVCLSRQRVTVLTLIFLVTARTALEAQRERPSGGDGQRVVLTLFITSVNRRAPSRAWLSSGGLKSTVHSAAILSAMGCRRLEFEVPAQLQVFGDSGTIDLATMPNEPDLIVEARREGTGTLGAENARLRGQGFVLSIKPTDMATNLTARQVLFTPADSSEARTCRRMAAMRDSLSKLNAHALRRLGAPT